MMRRVTALLTFLAAAVSLAAAQTRPFRIYVTAAGAPLVSQGLALAEPPASEAGAFQDVPAPAVRNTPSSGYAQATIAPWIESNGWRFERGLRRARYPTLPRGTASLAAAEVFAFDVEAILEPDPADVADLGKMLRFIGGFTAEPAMPPLANIGVVDDGSPEAGEALNLLTRRNLLYRIVRQPDSGLDLNVRLGTSEFPRESLADPNDFAARVRERLGDDKRFVRLYNTNTTIARLTGTPARERLVLLTYGRNRVQQDVRVRVLGNWQPRVAALNAPAGPLATDIEHVEGATEFTIPRFDTIAIVDLTKAP
jgi:hypothetical protein